MFLEVEGQGLCFLLAKLRMAQGVSYKAAGFSHRSPTLMTLSDPSHLSKAPQKLTKYHSQTECPSS